LNFDHLIEDMKNMPEGSCILLHACAQDPTGMDPTLTQWKAIRALLPEMQGRLLWLFKANLF
jgi:aspartate aminotransferase